MFKRFNEKFSEDLDIQSNRVFSDLYLNEVYNDILSCFFTKIDIESESKPVLLEIGSSGGITKKLDSNWITSDLVYSKELSLQFSATQIPLKNNSVDVIYCQDVLHHINNLTLLVKELKRVLKKNGYVLVKEPYWGFFAQIIWRLLHPEDFSLRKLKIHQKFNHPMEGNQALAWAVIKNKNRDLYNLFNSQFDVIELGPKLSLSFVLSGGATFTSSISRSFLINLYRIEKNNERLFKVFSTAFLFILKNSKGD